MAKSVFDALTDSDVDELLAKLEAQQKLKRLQEEGGDTGDTGDVSEEEAAAAEKAALVAEAKAKAEADAAAKAEEEAKAAALAAVQQAPSKSVTGDNIFTPISVKAVQTSTETGKGGDAVDITEVGKIPVVTDPALIGADGGAFSGGLGKPSTNLADVLRQDITYASGYRPGQGIFVNPEEAARLGVDQGNIFLSNPNLLNAPSLTGAVPGISPGGPAVGGGPTPIDVKTKAGTTITSEELSQKIVDRVAQREAQTGVKLSDAQLNSVVEDVMDEIYGPVASGGVNRPLATGQGGIPLVIPIPGLDPTSAAILTAAGLIFSGGKIARLNPNDPLGSISGAVQGVGQTGQNVINVVTGQDTLENIWSGGTTPSSGTGGGPAGQQTTGAGTILTAAPGILSSATGGTGPFVGPVAAQQQTTGTVGVTPGSLGGSTTPTSQVSIRQEGTATNEPIIARTQSDWGQVVGTGPADVVTKEEDVKVGPPVIAIKSDVATAPDYIVKQTPAVDAEPTVPKTTVSISQTGTASGGDIAKTTGGPLYAGTGTSGPGPTASTTIFTPMPAFTFTKTTPGDLAMRDFEKEFGLTSSTLMGQPGKDLANFYQQLQSQFTPSTLTQLAGTSQQQLMSDLDRLAMAQRGQLSPEDVRSAQQSAREAYAARGQVMAPGAIGAEILNRDVLRRQREAEARANVQQSMSNLGAAAQLQTGNIFAPFANLLAKTYGPTNEYANAVYDYNVNAYNAYQAAQENLAAYKEAAAKGQQAEFISTFANFLAKNGVATTWNALENIFKKIGGTPSS